MLDYHDRILRRHPQEGKTVTAAGASAQVAYGPCPAGVEWYFERVSVFSNTAGTPTAELYVLSAPALDPAGSRMSRADYTPNGKNDVLDEVNPMYVPEGYFLVVVWPSGLSANDICSASAQVAVAEPPKNQLSRDQSYAHLARKLADELEIRAGRGYQVPAAS